MDITIGDINEMALAASYADLGKIALRILGRAPQPVAMICGPLTTGGTSPDENWERMRTRIFSLEAGNAAVFNQLPFLRQARKISARTAKKRRGRSIFGRLFSLGRKEEEVGIDRVRFREEFHLPLLKAGMIREIYFLSGWHDSVGSRWYHDQAEKLGIQIKYLPEGLGMGES